MDEKSMEFESTFDIKDVSFRNVSSSFERKYREHYFDALKNMSDSSDRFTNANGANSLGILEKMAQKIRQYDENTDFEKSYREVMKEYERFTET